MADARANLPEILNDVEAGKEFHLTRRGRAVAVMLSPQRYEALVNRSDFGDAYRAFVARYPLDQVGVDDDFFESTRDRQPGRRVRL